MDWILTPRSVGGRITLAVNLLVGAATVGFLLFDYHRESHQWLLEKQGYTVRVLNPGYEELVKAGFKSADAQ